MNGDENTSLRHYPPTTTTPTPVVPHPRPWCLIPTMRSSPLLPLALIISATSEVLARAGGLRASSGAEPHANLLQSALESSGLDASGMIHSLLDRLLHRHSDPLPTAAAPTAQPTAHPTTVYNAPTVSPTRAFSPPTASPTEAASEGYSYSYSEGYSYAYSESYSYSYDDVEFSFSYADSASHPHPHPHPRSHEMWTETAAMDDAASHSFSYLYTDDAAVMDDTVVTPSSAPASFSTNTPTLTPTGSGRTSTPTASVSASEQPALPRATSTAHGTGTTGTEDYFVH